MSLFLLSCLKLGFSVILPDSPVSPNPFYFLWLFPLQVVYIHEWGEPLARASKPAGDFTEGLEYTFKKKNFFFLFIREHGEGQREKQTVHPAQRPTRGSISRP